MPAFAASAPERKVGPKFTITLANLDQMIWNCHVIIIFFLPDHEESKSHALGAVLDQESHILVILLGQDGSVVQDHRQQVHLNILILRKEWAIDLFKDLLRYIGYMHITLTTNFNIHKCNFILHSQDLINMGFNLSGFKLLRVHGFTFQDYKETRFDIEVLKSFTHRMVRYETEKMCTFIDIQFAISSFTAKIGLTWDYKILIVRRISSHSRFIYWSGFIHTLCIPTLTTNFLYMVGEQLSKHALT